MTRPSVSASSVDSTVVEPASRPAPTAATTMATAAERLRRTTLPAVAAATRAARKPDSDTVSLLGSSGTKSFAMPVTSDARSHTATRAVTTTAATAASATCPALQ